MSDPPWFAHYDEGVPTSIDYPAVPLYKLLEESASNFPDRPCAIFKGNTLTYGEVDELSDRLAAGLAASGVGKGTPVAIFMPNSPQFLISFYAILKAGGIVVATNPLYTAREIEHQMNDSGAQIMLVMRNFYKTIKEVQTKTPLKSQRDCTMTDRLEK